MFLAVVQTQYQAPLSEAELKRGEDLADTITVKGTGFHSLYGVSVSDTETLAIIVFDDEANALSTRENLRSATQNQPELTVVSTKRLAGEVQTCREKGPVRKGMFVTVTDFQFPRGETEAEAQAMEKEIYDGIMAKSPGFRALYRAKVSDTEKVLVSVWDNEADFHKSSEQSRAENRNLRQQPSPKLGPLPVSAQTTSGQVRTCRVKVS
jgi:heme-degrading monooxygenase HmoA